MQKLSEKNGQEITERALRFLSIRLKSRPQAKEFAAVIDAERKALQSHYEVWTEAREQRVANTAEISYLDERLGQTVGALSLAALVLANNDRKSATFTKLFPTAPSQMLLGHDESQDTHINALLQRLAEDKEYETLSTYTKQLGLDLEALHAAINMRKATYVNESKAQTDYLMARDKAQRAYNLTHPRLQLTFPEDTALIESFFIKINTSSPESPNTSNNNTPA